MLPFFSCYAISVPLKIVIYNGILFLLDQDPELMAAFNDPEVMAALQDSEYKCCLILLPSRPCGHFTY